jgi:hypothetical protein
MKCETFQSELLGLPDPRQLPETMRRHADGCKSCRSVAEYTMQVEATLAKLPVPASTPGIQDSFLEKISLEPVIIRREPPLPKRDSGSFVKDAFREVPTWKILSGLAASLLVAAGVWWAFREPTPIKGPAIVHHRHELLSKQVQYTVALTKATTAPKRMSIWTEVANDLRSEAQLVYLVAPGEEMNKLSTMFDNAVQNGILKQADAIPALVPTVERNQLLKDSMDRLQKAEQDAAALSLKAPPQSQDALKRIAQSAKKGHQRLQTLLQQGGA